MPPKRSPGSGKGKAPAPAPATASLDSLLGDVDDAGGSLRRSSRSGARVVSYKELADVGSDEEGFGEGAAAYSSEEQDEFDDDNSSDNDDGYWPAPSKRGGRVGRGGGRGRGGRGRGRGRSQSAAAAAGGAAEGGEEEEEDFAAIAGLEAGDEFYFMSEDEEEGDEDGSGSGSDDEDDDEDDDDEEEEDEEDEEGDEDEDEELDYERGGGAAQAGEGEEQGEAAGGDAPASPISVPVPSVPRPSTSASMLEYASMTRAFEEVGPRGPLIMTAPPGTAYSSVPFIDHVSELQRLTARRGRKRRRRGSGGRWSEERVGQKKKKVKKRGATGGRVMPEALSKVYGEAQRHYMRAEYREALRLLNEIIRQAPNVPEPYQLMGQIYEDERDLKKAAEINLVGCQFGPKDAALWKKTGQMFLELGRPFFLKAQYCFGRAIKLNGKDIEAIADRAHVQSLWGKTEKAIYGYEQVLRLGPPQPEVYLLRLAEEYLRIRKHWERGLLALGEVLCRTLGALFVAKQIKFLPLKPKAERHVPTKKMEFAYEAASALCRHLMAQGRFDQAAAVVQALHFFVAKLRERQTRFEADDTDQQLALPLDLVVRFGICQLHLDKLASALQCFASLRQRDPADPETAELLEDVASAFMATGKYFRALEILRRLDQASTPAGGGTAAAPRGGAGGVLEMFEGDGEGSRGPVAAVRVKLKMARSYLALGQHKGALPVLDQVDAACSGSTAGANLHYPLAAAEAAAKEAVVLRAWAARGVKDKGAMGASLARLTQALDQSVEAAAAEMATGAAGPGGGKRSLARPYFATWGRVEGFGRLAGEEEEEDGQDGEEGGNGGDGGGDEDVEPATSASAAAVELELCLEYGMLCRDLGKRQDFLSVALSLVELAVFQSKAEFRRARKRKRRINPALEAAGGAFDEEDEEEDDDAPVGGGADLVATAVKVSELVARAWERSKRQRALESHVKVYFQRLELMSLLGEGRMYEAFKAAVEACVDASLLREATDLVRAVVRRKRLLSEEHSKELQDLLLAHAVNEDDYTSAIKSALVGVAAEPHKVELGNALARLVRKAPRDDVSRAVIRRMALKQGDSVPLHMLSGNAFSLSRNYQMALDRFVAAYRLQPDDPLISLAAAALLARVVDHRKVVDRHGCLVRALAFLERYATLRRAQPPEEELVGAAEGGDGGGEEEEKEKEARAARRAAAKLAMEQEATYNTARALHQAGLGHAAVHLYRDCLDFYEAHKGALGALSGKGHVTREAAYNLVALYQGAGSRDLARIVAEKYLRVE